MSHVRQIAVGLWGIGEQDHILHYSYLHQEVREEERQSQGEEVVVLRWLEEAAGAPGPRASAVAAGQQQLAGSTGSRPRSFGIHHKRRKDQRIHSTGHTPRCSRRRCPQQPVQWGWQKHQATAGDVAGDDRCIGLCTRLALRRRGSDLHHRGRSRRHSCVGEGCP